MTLNKHLIRISIPKSRYYYVFAVLQRRRSYYSETHLLLSPYQSLRCGWWRNGTRWRGKQWSGRTVRLVWVQELWGWSEVEASQMSQRMLVEGAAGNRLPTRTLHLRADSNKIYSSNGKYQLNMFSWCWNKQTKFESWYLLSSEMFPSEESSEALTFSWDLLRELWLSVPNGKPCSTSSLVGLS